MLTGSHQLLTLGSKSVLKSTGAATEVIVAGLSASFMKAFGFFMSWLMMGLLLRVSLAWPSVSRSGELEPERQLTAGHHKHDL
jgi:hypothetical protein